MASAIYQTQIFGFAGPWHGFSNRSALIDYHGKQCAGVARDGAPDGTVATALAGGPLRYRDAEVQIAIAGAPYFDGDLQSTGAPDIAAKLAIEYKRGGADSIARLRGGFAAAIVDAKRNATLLAVDRMGIERLAYAVASDSIVFGSRVDAVARFPARTASIRPQALFDFLLMHMIPSPDTVYDGVMKLRPGTTVTFHAGRLDVRAHWTPVFFERGRADMPALATELREKLRGAVTACRPEAASGSFLSGGLDSSTVTGVLAEVAGRGRPSFSIGFGVEGYDELSYARTASGHFGSQAHEYVVTPADIVAVLPRIAAAY
ncbi:MAG: asparagine synthase-related protein, partial [Steroidobacterales bacterium]